MQYLKHFAVTGICLIIYLSVCNGLVRRYNYDANLYEEMNTESRSAQYSRTEKGLWANFTTLALQTFGHVWHEMICTRGGGSWIAYPNAKYHVGDRVYYYLIIGEICMSTENIESIQPMGEIQAPLDDGVIVFPEEHFQGQNKHVVKNSYSGEVGSLVYVGGPAWTISGGADVCMFPAYGNNDLGLCVIPTVDASLKLTGKSKTVREGCSNEKARLFTAETCYGPGAHKLYLSSVDFAAEKMSGICGKGSATDETKGKFSATMEIWKGRISHGIEDMESIKLPYEAAFKNRILYQVVEIFHKSCSSVPPPYLSILRNVFLMHLRRAWGGHPDIIGYEDDYWRHTALFLDSCSGHISESPGLQNIDVGCEAFDEGPGAHPDEFVFDELMAGEGFDEVIEQMWLVFNLVSPYCNWINSYKTNDWTNIISLLRRSFFDPVSFQWIHPGKWQRTYHTMFHGFDMVMMRDRILSCVKEALHETPDFDPIGRTKYILIQEYQVEDELDHNVTRPEGQGKKGGGGGGGPSPSPSPSPAPAPEDDEGGESPAPAPGE